VELRRRCPGFLECDELLREADWKDDPQTWRRLMRWGNEHFFGEAEREGWFDGGLTPSPCWLIGIPGT